MAARELPGGTVTLLFTDIEGSTRLLQELGREAYVRALTDHRRLLREAFSRRGGVEVESQGDSFHFAFPVARDAVLAAVEGQQALAEHDWESQPIRVRIGLHTGEPMRVDGLYAGLDVHWAARVMGAAHGGQILVSERAAEAVRDELPNTVRLADLGEHRLKDLSAPQRLYQVPVAGQPADFPPLRTLRVTNLPVQAHRLIGRHVELEEITRRLRAKEVRLLTLTGSGGTGKTRLAVHAAAAVNEHFEGGTFFVPLAAIRDPTLVLATIAKSLGLRTQAGETVGELLSEHLGQKECLLVLDNFEQVVDAAPEIAAILSRTPTLSLLVTSREPLRIAGEHCFPVQALPLPLDLVSTSASDALENDAVALFVERARAAHAGFELTSANAASVAGICARLDGLPLAIELAAAHTGVLSPTAMLKRLDRSLDLLTGGRRDADERQRTLRSTIEWSYELLDHEERELFARLAVFVGGCSLAAVEAICAAGSEAGVLRGVAALTEKSLLQAATESSEPRFWMLETIRDYAAEQLERLPDHEQLRRRHAEWFIGLAEDADFAGEEAEAWLAALELEHDNFRAALAWSVEARVPDMALRLGSGLSPLWELHGYFREGRNWLELALALPPPAERLLTAKALDQIGVFSYAQGDLDRAEEVGAAALEVFVELDDHENVSHSLTGLARVARQRGDLARARSLYEESGRVAREAGLARQIAASVLNLGDLALYEGDYERAESLAREARVLLRELGSAPGTAFACMNVAVALILRGDPGAAVAELHEVVELSSRLGWKEGQAAAFDTLGAALAGDGKPHEAAVLLGAAEAIREEIGSRREGFESSMIEGATKQLADQLGAADLAMAMATGAGMATDKAIEYALEQTGRVRTVSTT